MDIKQLVKIETDKLNKQIEDAKKELEIRKLISIKTLESRYNVKITNS